MHISGINPRLQVILNQAKYDEFLKCDALIMPKQVKAERDCVIIPQNYNFGRYYRRTI